MSIILTNQRGEELGGGAASCHEGRTGYILTELKVLEKNKDFKQPSTKPRSLVCFKYSLCLQIRMDRNPLLSKNIPLLHLIYSLTQSQLSLMWQTFIILKLKIVLNNCASFFPLHPTMHCSFMSLFISY